MPQFFFNIRQSRLLFEDKRGGKFSDIGEALIWAMSDVRAMIREGELDGPVEQHCLEICDMTGDTVASLPFVRVLHPN